MKILIADDDLLFRILLERSIRAWGYEPVVVTDGESAWRELERADGPQLALLDWVMPGVDGLEICRRVRGAALSRYVYLILLTAKTEPHDLISGLEAGADEFVAKPVDLERLRLQVKTGIRILEAESRNRRSDPPELLQAQLRSISARLFRIQEEERSMIARELHEGVAQDLSSVLMHLGIAETAGDERRSAILRRASTTTEETLRRVRSLAYTLYPLLLDEIGLVAALRHYAEGVWTDGRTQIDLALPANFGRAARPVERALFRIAQEAVDHIKESPTASRAVIRLARSGSEIRLEVQQEGAGTLGEEEDSAEGPGAAVLEMRERADQAGGRLELLSGEGGAVVLAVLPADDNLADNFS
jgi:DNA-binding response OmpR family regulator